MALVIAPYTIRNYRVSNRLVAVNAQDGWAVWALSATRDAEDGGAGWNTIWREQGEPLFKRVTGSTAYSIEALYDNALALNDAYRAEARRNIRSDPWRFAVNVLRNLYVFNTDPMFWWIDTYSDGVALRPGCRGQGPWPWPSSCSASPASSAVFAPGMPTRACWSRSTRCSAWPTAWRSSCRATTMCACPWRCSPSRSPSASAAARREPPPGRWPLVVVMAAPLLVVAAQFTAVRPTNFAGADEWLVLSLASRGIIDFPYAGRPLALLWCLPGLLVRHDLIGHLLTQVFYLAIGGRPRRVDRGAPARAFAGGGAPGRRL